MYQNTTQQSIDQGYTQHEYLVTQVLYNHTTIVCTKRSMQLTDSNYTWNTMQIIKAKFKKSNSDIGKIQSTKVSCMDMALFC